MVRERGVASGRPGLEEISEWFWLTRCIAGLTPAAVQAGDVRPSARTLLRRSEIDQLGGGPDLSSGCTLAVGISCNGGRGGAAVQSSSLSQLVSSSPRPLVAAQAALRASW
jgi:hypothetical protein